jgi:hypothetical protein
MHILDPREIRVSYVSTGVTDCQLDLSCDWFGSVSQPLPGLVLKMYRDVVKGTSPLAIAGRFMAFRAIGIVSPLMRSGLRYGRISCVSHQVYSPRLLRHWHASQS